MTANFKLTFTKFSLRFLQNRLAGVETRGGESFMPIISQGISKITININVLGVSTVGTQSLKENPLFYLFSLIKIFQYIDGLI